MGSTGRDELVVIGRVVKAHGIRGEVVVHPLSDVPGRFDAGTEVVLAGVARTITTTRAHQGRLLLAFDGVVDRDAAERLRGQEVLAPPVDVSDSETFYAHELIGCEVHHVDGRPLGVVTALIELPEAAGYDLLEVDRAGATWLLPCADELVEAVEAEDGTLVLVVDPPEGLIDGEPEVVPDLATGGGDPAGTSHDPGEAKDRGDGRER
ncbi:MAG: ribosome maturation factor RimM [Nitriliruptoraceae bacterium]